MFLGGIEDVIVSSTRSLFLFLDNFYLFTYGAGSDPDQSEDMKP